MQDSSNHTIHQNRIRDLIGLIESRRLIRHYHPALPEQSVIDRILQSAAAAPNAHNAQPWRFYLLDDRIRREKLVLEQGMVLNVEPPYYELGLGGFQLEDTVVVTDKGFRFLTTLGRDLMKT